MLETVAFTALPCLVAALHRIRGGGIVPGLLPRQAWIAITSVVIVGLCLLAGAWWPVAVTLGLTYGLWCLPGWMPEITAAEGATVPSDQVMSSTWDVIDVEWLSFGNSIVAIYLRAALPLIPGGVALILLDAFADAGPFYDAVPLAAIALLFFPIYELAYQIDRTNQSAVAEPIMGAVIGGVCAAVVALA